MRQKWICRRFTRGLDRASGKIIEPFEAFLNRPGAAPAAVILLWACSALPNLTVRSFTWEEGTNAEIARDILARGHFLVPYVYGICAYEKPSLLGWLIAGFAALTGGVDEWSARLPAMISVLLTALLVQRVTRLYASLHASLFAALSFLFSPLLLQKLTIAEPDTVVTLLSFSAFVFWWNGSLCRSRADPALDRLRVSPCNPRHGQRSATGGIFCPRRAGLPDHRTKMAGPAGLAFMRNAAHCGHRRLGCRDLSAWRSNGMVGVRQVVSCAAQFLRLHRDQFPQHRQLDCGIAAGNSCIAICAMAVAAGSVGVLCLSNCCASTALFGRMHCGARPMAGLQRPLRNADCARACGARWNRLGRSRKIQIFGLPANRGYATLHVHRLSVHPGRHHHAAVRGALWSFAKGWSGAHASNTRGPCAGILFQHRHQSIVLRERTVAMSRSNGSEIANATILVVDSPLRRGSICGAQTRSRCTSCGRNEIRTSADGHAGRKKIRHAEIFPMSASPACHIEDQLLCVTANLGPECRR